MRGRPGKTVASAEHARLRQLTETLRHNLEACAKDATVDAVHDTRTGTRRIEAMLDSLLREGGAEGPESESEKTAALHEAALQWSKLLKKIRRAAGAVRDLDVHRKLLEKQWLPKKNGGHEGASESSALGLAEGGLTPAEALSGTDVPGPVSDPIKEQARDLDTWLKHARQHHAQPLMKAAGKWSARLEGELASFEGAMHQVRRRRTQSASAVVALEEFARLSHQMQRLDEGNLHDFRKGAKKARYMAEAGGDDRDAGLVGKALKRLQDEIGDWHDWLVLAEEAHQALGANGAELTALIEAQRDEHYSQAMQITERMRGRLLGELQALSQQRRTRAGAGRVVKSQTQIS
jgi:CHAD domain-containing protein